MIIPNKHSGYQAGIRLYPGGGGGGGGGDGGTGDAASAAGGDVGPGAAGTGNGTAAGGGDSGSAGGGGDGTYVPPVTNTGNTGNTGSAPYIPTSWNPTPVTRQPVYQSQYMNYARPATQFDTSMYGTQPVYSPARAWNDRNSGSAAGGQQVVNNAISNYFQQNPNSDINSTLAAMRDSGINRTDIQSWGGVNNYSPSVQQPQMNWQTGQMTQPAQQAPFNPYTNNFGYGSGSMPQMQNPFSQPAQQMQSPYSYQQPMQQSSYGYNQPSAMTPRPPMQPPIQNPFSYQQQSYGPSPLPSYVYDTINDLGQYQSQPVRAYQPTTQPYQSPVAKSSGPSQAIVGRSSQMRGTPNVMRRAGGGIMSLMDDE